VPYLGLSKRSAALGGEVTSEDKEDTIDVGVPSLEVRAPTSEIGRPTLKVHFFNDLHNSPRIREIVDESDGPSVSEWF